MTFTLDETKFLIEAKKQRLYNKNAVGVKSDALPSLDFKPVLLYKILFRN